MGIHQFDFLERVVRALSEVFGAEYDLYKGMQDNRSFGDAIVVVRVCGVICTFRRQRDEVLLELGGSRGEPLDTAKVIASGGFGPAHPISDSDASIVALLQAIRNTVRRQ